MVQVFTREKINNNNKHFRYLYDIEQTSLCCFLYSYTSQGQGKFIKGKDNLQQDLCKAGEILLK